MENSRNEEYSSSSRARKVFQIPNGHVKVTTKSDGATEVSMDQNGETSSITSRNGSFVQLSSKSFGIEARVYEDGSKLIAFDGLGGVNIYENEDEGGVVGIGEADGRNGNLDVIVFPDGDRLIEMDELRIRDYYGAEERARSRARGSNTDGRHQSNNRRRRSQSRRSRHRSGRSRRRH